MVLIIECPNCGRELDTGVDVPKGAVEEERNSECAQCGELVEWSKDDVIRIESDYTRSA